MPTRTGRQESGNTETFTAKLTPPPLFHQLEAHLHYQVLFVLLGKNGTGTRKTWLSSNEFSGVNNLAVFNFS